MRGITTSTNPAMRPAVIRPWWLTDNADSGSPGSASAGLPGVASPATVAVGAGAATGSFSSGNSTSLEPRTRPGRRRPRPQAPPPARRSVPAGARPGSRTRPSAATRSARQPHEHPDGGERPAPALLVGPGERPTTVSSSPGASSRGSRTSATSGCGRSAETTGRWPGTRRWPPSTPRVSSSPRSRGRRRRPCRRPPTHAAGTPASIARSSIRLARVGLVANPAWSGTPTARHRAGSSVHERGRYSSRSMIPCPVSLAWSSCLRASVRRFWRRSHSP